MHKEGYGKHYPVIASTKPQTVHAEEEMECQQIVNARCAVIHFEKRYAFSFHSALNLWLTQKHLKNLFKSAFSQATFFSDVLLLIH